MSKANLLLIFIIEGERWRLLSVRTLYINLSSGAKRTRITSFLGDHGGLADPDQLTIQSSWGLSAPQSTI